MKRISLYFAVFLILSLGFYFSSYAQGPQDLVDSDYLRDIKLGEEQIKNDPQAQEIQKEITQSEKPQAQVESQPVVALETVSDQEAQEDKVDLQPEDNKEKVELEIQEDQKNTPEPVQESPSSSDNTSSSEPESQTPSSSSNSPTPEPSSPNTESQTSESSLNSNMDILNENSEPESSPTPSTE